MSSEFIFHSRSMNIIFHDFVRLGLNNLLEKIISIVHKGKFIVKNYSLLSCTAITRSSSLSLTRWLTLLARTGGVKTALISAWFTGLSPNNWIKYFAELLFSTVNLQDLVMREAGDDCRWGDQWWRGGIWWSTRERSLFSCFSDHISACLLRPPHDVCLRIHDTDHDHNHWRLEPSHHQPTSTWPQIIHTLVIAVNTMWTLVMWLPWIVWIERKIGWCKFLIFWRRLLMMMRMIRIDVWWTGMLSWRGMC